MGRHRPQPDRHRALQRAGGQVAGPLAWDPTGCPPIRACCLPWTWQRKYTFQLRNRTLLLVFETMSPVERVWISSRFAHFQSFKMRWNRVQPVEQPRELVLTPLLVRANIDRKSTRLNSSHLVISYAV